MSVNHRVLNLGAGTQSSVLLIMCDRGDVEPVDVAIFADTQAEPREVYEHLNWLEKQVKTPVVRVTAGSLREAALRGRVSKKTGKIWAKGLPYWIHDSTGKLGKIRKRQCTVDYKIVPINRYIKQQLGKPLPKSPVVSRVFGISYDEMQRMRTSTDAWAVNEYPLVEQRLTRSKVIDMARKWFPGREFPRSACTFCPFHQNDEWRRLREKFPADFADAVDFDESARALHSQPQAALQGLVYIHRDGVPLRDANLDDAPANEDLLFGLANECEGMCGV
jgi:hypothetical protein